MVPRVPVAANTRPVYPAVWIKPVQTGINGKTYKNYNCATADQYKPARTDSSKNVVININDDEVTISK